MFEPRREPYGLPVAAGDYIPPAMRQGPFPGYQQAPDLDLESEERFNPLKLIWYVIHYRWLIAAMMAAALISGLLVTWMQTPLFKATVKVEILTAGAKVLQDLEVFSQADDFRAFETARQKMLSRELARRVAYELDLAQDDAFLAPTPRFSVFNFLGRIVGASAQDRIADLPAERRERLAVALVQQGISAELVRNTSILAVTFSHARPAIAARVANQVAQSYIDQGVDSRSETSDVARQFIEQQASETKAKLQASEKALIEYAKQAGITITGNDASLISESITEINKALSDAIQQRLAVERLAQQVEEGNAASLPEVFESVSISESKQKIAELKATYQEKLSTLKPGFPEMRRLQAQINELQNQMNQEIAAIARSVQIRFEQAKEAEAAMQRELSQLEARQRDFQDKNIQYTILRREVDSNRTQYESLINKLNEVGVGSELKSTNAFIVDPAVQPGAPYSPRLPINLAVALALFGALSAAIVYLLEMMNNTFAVPDQIESELKVPVLGIIPFADEEGLAEGFRDSKSALSEAFRSLRTSLQFAGAEGSMRTLLVTSAEPSEGKSTASFKLAQDFAALGRKVLIIDADLRRPRMHRLFNTDNSIGLSNLLSNVVRQGDVISIFRRTSDPNVTFMSAGTVPPNPVDLLTSQKMAMTLHFCAKKFDLVIVDSPPVMGLSDAPILSRQVDATLLVVSAKQVSRKSAKNALSRLRAAGGNVVGAALTKFQVDSLDYNYAYRYMGYNYYTYESAQPRIESFSASDAPKGDRGNGGKTGAFARLRSVFGRAAA